MQRRTAATTPAIGMFALFVFVLTAVPRLNLKVGPLPLYAVDFLIIGLLIASLGLPRVPREKRPFSGTIVLLLVLALASELVGMIRFGTLLESVYIMGRTVLAFSVFFLASKFVRTMKDVEIVLRAVVAGTLVTASLMILTSLPMTRPAVTEMVFSRSFLEPAAEQSVDEYLGAGDSGVRGRTLVGVSILGATFINVCWPLAALLLRWPAPIGLWRNVALAACLLAPMGVLMSYSRGPILGSLIIVAAAIVLGLGRLRRGIVVPVMIGAGIVLMVGIGSQLFFFDRLTNRTEAIFDAPLADERESERLLAYSEPFAHVAEHPEFMILGEGVTLRFATITRPVPQQSGKATHAVFAMAYYSYGMLAAFLYLFLIARAILYAGNLALRERRTPAGFLAQPVLLSVIALIPWFAFGHAAVSTPRGAMLLFLVIGLTSALERFRVPHRQRKSSRPVPYAYRRNPALG